MKTALIGYTGYVGGNLNSQHRFTYLYNSKNIDDICGQSYDLVVCAGVRADKWLANRYPDKDMQAIDNLKARLDKMHTDCFVQISTIDVYKYPNGVDENTLIDTKGLHVYGLNRYRFEQWVQACYEHHLIVRLPALFGQGLRKNFIYDMTTRIPSIIVPVGIEKLRTMLPPSLFQLVLDCYRLDDFGNYKLRPCLDKVAQAKLLDILQSVNFTSLQFTDCCSQYQFYCLDYLWEHIQIGLRQGIELLNLSVEPVSAQQVAEKCFGESFTHTIEGHSPVIYNTHTIHDDLFGGYNGYIFSAGEVLSQISKFLSEKRGSL